MVRDVSSVHKSAGFTHDDIEKTREAACLEILADPRTWARRGTDDRTKIYEEIKSKLREWNCVSTAVKWEQ